MKKRLYGVFVSPQKLCVEHASVYVSVYYAIVAVYTVEAVTAAGAACSVKIFRIISLRDDIRTPMYVFTVHAAKSGTNQCRPIDIVTISVFSSASFVVRLHLYESIELNACVQCNTVSASIRWIFSYFSFVHSLACEFFRLCIWTRFNLSVVLLEH